MSPAGKRYVVAYNSTAESNIIDFPDELKFHSHEEADTLIVLHSTDVNKRNPFCQLYVACSDTDVLLCFCTFTRRYVIILYFTLLHERLTLGGRTLENKKSMALLGLHVSTGCDLTERFSGFSKTTYFDTFFKSNSFVYKAFGSLGNNDNGLKEEIINGLTQFLLDLYLLKRPSNINALRQLRWYLFSKFQYDSEKLSPTSSALRFAIYRSHLVCNTWKKSLFRAPSYLNPEEYGWEYDTNSNSYEAVMTNQLAAPKHIVELCISKCKTGCESLRCSCEKNNLVCTEMCMCNDCKNCPNEELIISESWDT